MICLKCGKPIYADDDFCTYCGARTAEVQREAQSAGAKVTVYKVVLVIASVVAVLALLGAFLWYTGYEKVVDDFFKAYETTDDQLMSQVQAQCWIDYVDETWYEGRAMEIMEDDLEYADRGWAQRYGEDAKVEYEIVQTRRASSWELVDLEEDILDRYCHASHLHSEYEITDAYVVEVSYSVKGDKGSWEDEEPMELLLIKESGKWRIMYYGSVYSSFYTN